MCECDSVLILVQATRILCVGGSNEKDKVMKQCCRIRFAAPCHSQSLRERLLKLDSSENILAGDLNLNWFSPVSSESVSLCGYFNFIPLIGSPSRPNPKCHTRSTLIALGLINVLHQFCVTF